MEQAFQNAAWIWRREPAGNDEFCDFIDSVYIPDNRGDGRYYLHISADSNYTVWLGGRLAAFGQYADYPDYKVYDRVDITQWLMPGVNRLAITVWYYGVGTQTYRPGRAGLIYEITDETGQVVATSGTHTRSRLSWAYKSGTCEFISKQLGFTYHADLRGDDGFRVSGEEGFTPSRIETGITKDLHLRPNKKLILGERMPATIIRAGSFTYTTDAETASENMQSAAIVWESNVNVPLGTLGDTATTLASTDSRYPGVFFLVDLGAETAGFLDIDLDVPADCRIDVGYGEHLEDGICRTAIRGFSCDVKAKAGRNTYLHTFRRFGCRYLQFFVHAPSVTVRYAGITPTLYPLTHKSYRSGNYLRDTIYRVSQNTLQHCLHEHYEDCPWREQALYTLDSRNQMLCGYYAFGETEAARASLELISHGLRSDGLLMLCYPAGLDYPIPSFSCAYFLQMEEYIRYSGDTTLAAEKFPILERLLETFEARMQAEGVIENFYGEAPDDPNGYWNFYEWSDTMDGEIHEMQRRLECPINCFYSLALRSMAGICDALNKGDRAACLRARAADLNAAIARVFYNPATKLFESFDIIHRGTYTVLTQSLAVLCGAADGVDTSVMLPLMVQNGGEVSGRRVVPNTLSMNAFRFDALLAIDRATYAPVILDELDRSYLAMLRAGATTFWETALGAADFEGAGSLCHGWSALPIYYYETLFSRGSE